MRADVDAGAAGARWTGRIDAATMIAHERARSSSTARSFAEIGASSSHGGFVGAAPARRGGAGEPGARAGAARASSQRLFAPDFGRLPREHLLLVFGSLALARRGRRSARHRRLALAAQRRARCSAPSACCRRFPSLALLAFLIALVGSIGVVPALIALFLYALLPIVRNTHAGLRRRLARA